LSTGAAFRKLAGLMNEQEPRNLKIVVVDDSEVVREQLRRAFAETQGLHLVGMAASGDEGIEMAQSLRPDIIVLDLSMPKRSGLDTLREIRKVDQRVMIIIFTSDDSVPLRWICREAGANFFVTKSRLKDLLDICSIARRTT
jgi:DNA-binding NarL/FixJ family response regulator